MTELSGTPIAILGAGAVGRALALELARAGARLRLWSRTRRHAEDVAALVRASGAEVSVAPDLAPTSRLLARAELALVCVSDVALEPLAHALTGTLPAGAPPVICHTSGFHGPEVLAALRERGVETGRLHPLAAFPPSGAAAGPLARSPLRGAWFSLSGTPAAEAELRRLVVALEGHELRLRPGADLALYHAAAALLSGGTVALLDLCGELLAGLSEDGAAARAAAGGLLGGTVANALALGARGALTGPAARGASELVRVHLARLAEASPAAARLYRELGRRMVALAAERGSLPPERRAELESLLLD